MLGISEHELEEAPNTPLQTKLVEISNAVKDLETISGLQLTELTENSRAIEQMEKVISQQETAILLLKQYVLDNGLPAFWDPKVMTTLKKPIQDMTVGELIERNRNANRYKRAKSVDTTPFPTHEELIQRYTPKKPTPITDLMDASVNDEAPTAVPPGEISSPTDDSDSASGFGSFREDS